jgi:hypothetical protein
MSFFINIPNYVERSLPLDDAHGEPHARHAVDP